MKTCTFGLLIVLIGVLLSVSQVKQREPEKLTRREKFACFVLKVKI